MSDTPDEIRDFIIAMHHSIGHVLINGLGLGVVLQAVAKRKEVESVTVIELSKDVINLAQNHYHKMFKEKIQIINDDAFSFKTPKGKRYNYVWHDIWDSICSDNLEQMKTLHRKYGRISDAQNSWCRYQCEQR